MFTITNAATSPSPPSIFQAYLLPALPFRRRKSSTISNITSNSSPLTSPGTSPSSVFSASSFSSTSSSPPTNAVTPTYLTGSTSHLTCSRCHADLALTSQIISKGFTGRHGRALLVSPFPPASSQTGASALLYPPSAIANNPSLLPNLPNTHTHKAVPRHLVTGLHTVCDISCALCGSVLGWKYVGAEEESQKYKIGKFILETRRVLGGSCWEGIDEEEEDTEEVLMRRWSDASGRGRRGSENVVDDGNEEEVMFDSQDEDECEDLFAGVWSPQLASRRRSRTMRS